MKTLWSFIRSRALWLTALFAGAAILWMPLPSGAQAPTAHVIRVEAKSFAYTPNVVRVRPGDRVSLDLVATDVVHGLYLDGYDLTVMAEPGQTARLTFIASQPGVFRFRCSVTCGPLHPFMIGKLYIGQPLGWWRGVGLLLVAAAAGLSARHLPWRATT